MWTRERMGWKLFDFDCRWWCFFFFCGSLTTMIPLSYLQQGLMGIRGCSPGLLPMNISCQGTSSSTLGRRGSIQAQESWVVGRWFPDPKTSDMTFLLFLKADPVNFPRVMHSVGSCHPTNIGLFQRARASVGAAPSAIAPRHQRICVNLMNPITLRVPSRFFVAFPSGSIPWWIWEFLFLFFSSHFKRMIDITTYQ